MLNIQYDCNQNHNTHWLWEDPNIILTSDSCGYTHALGDKELNGNIKKPVGATSVARCSLHSCQVYDNHIKL